MEETNHIILFSALDWGLGHTTRSIPILTQFNENGHQLLLAVQPGSASEKILQDHFPKAIFLPLKGYNITYAKKSRFFAIRIIYQIPKILRAISREHRFVKKMLRDYSIQLIVSDNRYGFHHKSVRSVFITHQLRIAAPFKWLESVIQRINYNYIEKFAELWIPDLNDIPNLGGKLSHPQLMPKIKTAYIGPLSRLSLLKETTITEMEVQHFKYLFLLSGPEPQRSVLEKRLREIASHLDGKAILVQGLPGSMFNQNLSTERNSQFKSGPKTPSEENQLTVISYAAPSQLSQLLQGAEFVICRSGYSTVMDLLLLGKKGIYIPTPGQTEQEYLAIRLMEQHWGFCFNQDEIDYLGQIQAAGRFPYAIPKSFARLNAAIF